MKVLILGSGAREHALAWKMAASPRVRRLFVGPGNAGTAGVAENLPAVRLSDFPSVLAAVRDKGIDSVFVGPEGPLAEGIVDFLGRAGVPVIGPSLSSARLEASKAFSKAFLVRNGIPTARAAEIREPPELESHLRDLGGRRLVLKKSGLAAGKGVLESSDPEELARFARGVLPGDSLLLEEFLQGWEVSVFGLSDGRGFLVLPPCTDFKKAHDGDTGPNTGGMGSVCPVPWVDEKLMQQIIREIVAPTYAAMSREGLSYPGVLYFGLMVTTDGPKVLEFNVRFGDPEAQVLLPLVDADLGELVEAMATGTLEQRFGWRRDEISRAAAGGRPRAALGVVVAGRGYPDAATGSGAARTAVEDLPRRLPSDTLLFHASTALQGDGRVTVGGGRCFTVVGIGADLDEAAARAYASVHLVRFPGGWCRSDIGLKFREGKR